MSSTKKAAFADRVVEVLDGPGDMQIKHARLHEAYVALKSGDDMPTDAKPAAKPRPGVPLGLFTSDSVVPHPPRGRDAVIEGADTDLGPPLGSVAGD